MNRWAADVASRKASQYDLSLAAFAMNNFREANERALDAAAEEEASIFNLQKQQRETVGRVIRDYRLAGDAAYNAFEFEKAAGAYSRALSTPPGTATKRNGPISRFELGTRRTRIFPLGRRGNPRSRTVRHQSLLSCFGSLQKRDIAPGVGEDAERSRHCAPPSGGAERRPASGGLSGAGGGGLSQCAASENPRATAAGLGGDAEQSRYRTPSSGGTERRAASGELIWSRRWRPIAARWRCYTREQLPQDWAGTQNNLGITLDDLAGRSEGPQAAAYLKQAVPPFAVRCRLTPASNCPQDWAMTQNNLGNALDDLAGRSEGASSGGLSGAGGGRLSQCAASQDPRAAAAGLGDDAEQSRQRARRSGGAERRAAGGRLSGAGGDRLSQCAASVYPRATAAGLGDDAEQSRDCARRSGGAERRARRRRSLKQAVAAFRSALQVRTREQLPQDWAATQNNLGTALDNLAGRSEGPQAVAYLEQAVAAFRSALQVYTREQLPQDWAMAQNNLGTARIGRGGAKDRKRRLIWSRQWPPFAVRCK